MNEGLLPTVNIGPTDQDCKKKLVGLRLFRSTVTKGGCIGWRPAGRRGPEPHSRTLGRNQSSRQPSCSATTPALRLNQRTRPKPASPIMVASVS